MAVSMENLPLSFGVVPAKMFVRITETCTLADIIVDTVVPLERNTSNRVLGRLLSILYVYCRIT
jgi:hypothetical protein